MGDTQAAVTDRSTCPVVFGEYMRASGCFYRTDSATYLVTARHNALPTNAKDLNMGSVSANFRTRDFLPTVDVYLRTPDGFDVMHYDIRAIQGVTQVPEIDLLAVPITVDPETYGYTVWDADSITTPAEADTSLDMVGFNGTPYPHPDREYSTQLYRDEIGTPVSLSLENDLHGKDDLSQYGLVAVGVDEGPTADLMDYNGFSGAPVMGEDLVGIHAVQWTPPQEAIEQVDGEKFNMTIYWRATILPKLLS